MTGEWTRVEDALPPWDDERSSAFSVILTIEEIRSGARHVTAGFYLEGLGWCWSRPDPRSPEGPARINPRVYRVIAWTCWPDRLEG